MIDGELIQQAAVSSGTVFGDANAIAHDQWQRRLGGQQAFRCAFCDEFAVDVERHLFVGGEHAYQVMPAVGEGFSRHNGAVLGITADVELRLAVVEVEAHALLRPAVVDEGATGLVWQHPRFDGDRRL